jgi:putative two-component system response regulator
MQRRKNILFVDDEPNFLRGLRRMLANVDEPWELWFAGSVAEALAVVTEQPIDAVVADVRMPGQDGFSLLESLAASEDTRPIPVVMLTGAREDDLKRAALDSGAADLLTKPVSILDLVARLRSVLRLKGYEDAIRSQNEMLERRVRERTAELEESRLDIILRLGKAAEYRDEDTGNHILRVGCYCRMLAERLGMDGGFVHTIFLASPLHDIGKIGIPDAILLKPGRLTAIERRIIERHCEIGAEILLQDPKSIELIDEWRAVRDPALRGLAAGQNPVLAMASAIAMSHHERWDGMGYPRGLARDEIPIEARITALADVYDALGAKRPYKPALPPPQVLSIMWSEAGRQFDPDVYAAFEEAIDQFDSIRTRHADDARAAA